MKHENQDWCYTSRFVDIGILLREKVDTWQFNVKFHFNSDMFSYKQKFSLLQIWKWLIRQTIAWLCSLDITNIFSTHQKETQICLKNWFSWALIVLFCIARKCILFFKNNFNSFGIKLEKNECINKTYQSSDKIKFIQTRYSVCRWTMNTTVHSNLLVCRRIIQ